MGWRAEQEDSEPSESPATMGRALAVLFFFGAASGALTLILPHSAHANGEGLWTNVTIALTSALGLATFARWLRFWMIHVILVLGTLVITRAVYLSHDAGSFYSFWYIWVGLFSFFFFGRKWGVIHLAVVGLAFGAVLTELPPASSVVRWLMTLATVIIGGVLVDILTQRVRSREAAARSRAQSLEIVANAAHELARQISATSVGAAICQAAVGASGAASASLWEPTADGRGLVANASSDVDARGSFVPFVQAGAEVIDAFVSGQRRRTATGQAGLFEPMILDGVPMAVLAIHWTDEEASADEQLGQVIQLLALEGALSLERAATLARLERVARTDDLTGLANRRSFDEHFGREIARSMRHQTPLAVALLDLDHFKDYNDRFGHPAGDRLLKEVSSNWAREVRATDVLARYGGEEFALLLPDVDAEEANGTLERLRSSMPANQRVSAGIVFWKSGEDAQGMLSRADSALYEAKTQGRDRVVSA